MNISLRKRHRVMTSSLAVVLPVVAIAGLALRKERPVGDLPEALLRSVDADSNVGDQIIRFPKLKTVSLAIHNTETGSGSLIQVSNNAPLKDPDVLLYWTSDPVTKSWQPGENSVFAGSVPGSGRAFYPVPQSAARGGVWVVYSLTHQAVLDMVEADHTP